MKKRFVGGVLTSLVLVACGTTDGLQDQAGSGDRVEAMGVTVTTGTLAFNYAFGVPSAKILVGPADGQVEVYGLPDVADGTIYTGIRRINWASGAGDDGLQLEVNQARDFDVVYNPGTSNANLQAKWIIPAGVTTAITPSLNVTTGPGAKSVHVDLESYSQDVRFALIGRMGAGPTDMLSNLQFKQGGAAANARVDFQFSGDLNDKAEILVNNEVPSLTLDIYPRFMRTLVTQITSDDFGTFAQSNFRPVAPAAGSIINYEMVSNSPIVNQFYNIRGGAGMDEVNLNLITHRTATVTSNLNLDLGQGNDKLEIKYDGQPSSQYTLQGPIKLGGSNDETNIVLSGIVNWGIALDCGDGIDKANGYTGQINCEQN